MRLPPKPEKSGDDLTLRDRFAIVALGPILAAYMRVRLDDALIAKTAYGVADAMLAERARGDRAGEAHEAGTRG